MTVLKNILGNTFIQIFGRVSTAILAILAVKIISSSLGVEGYGAYATVYEFLGIFAVAGDFGIYTIAIKEMSRQKTEKNIGKVYQNVLGLRILLSLFFLGLSVISVFFVGKYENTLIPYGVLITFFAVFLNLLNSVAISILQVKMKMQFAVFSLILGKIFSIGIIFYGAFFLENKDVEFFTFLLAGVLGHLLMTIISFIYAKKFVNILPKFDFGFFKKMIKKSFPYGLALIFGTIYFKIDTILLSILTDLNQVGIYSLGIRIIEVFAVIPIFFAHSILPHLTKTLEKSKEKVYNILNSSFTLLLAIGLPVVVFIYFGKTFIISIISSQEFLSGNLFEFGADFVLFLLSIAMFFSFFSIFLSVFFVGIEKTKFVLITNFLGAFLNVILNLFFIPKYGYLAAAWTSILCEVFVFLILFLFLQKFFKFFPEILQNFKIIFINFIIGFLLYFLINHFGNGKIEIFLSLGFGGILYLFLLWKIKILKILKI